MIHTNPPPITKESFEKLLESHHQERLREIDDPRSFWNIITGNSERLLMLEFCATRNAREIGVIYPKDKKAYRVRRLRLRTGAGMIHCKRAIEACLGDLRLAQEWLKVHSQAIHCPPGKHPRELVEQKARDRWLRYKANKLTRDLANLPQGQREEETNRDSESET